MPITLVQANADELAQALLRVPAAAHASGYAIGYWFWELSHFPLEFAEAFALVDEVWVPSRFCLEAFRPLARVPVRLVPPCVPAPGPPALSRAELGWDPEAFVAFACFDARSVPERKHPEALVAAFAQAHARMSRPSVLVVRIGNAADAPGLVERLRAQAQGLPLTIETQTVGREHLEASLAHCDAYLSLHRSEGLGLLPIEALHLGKPVIATAYGGVTDFLDEATGYPVPYRLVALEKDLPPYPRGAVWAEPDVDAAAEALSRVESQPEQAAARARAGRARVLALYGVEAAAARLRAELERLWRDGPGW
jgi:glycosyltransferase involved in cell wall biosynthesis